MKTTTILSALLLAMANVHVPAQTAPAPTTAAAASEMVEAEVRRIDKEGSRLTLKHAEIKSLDMPPMTMVVQVKNKAALDKLKVGDKVRFKAAKEDGKYVVTEIEAAP